jgi:hypothetical protein
MRHRTKILGIAVGLIVLLLLAWLDPLTPTPGRAVTLLITTNFPTTGQGYFTASLTNNTRSAINLDPLLVQFEDDNGQVFNNLGENWADKRGNLLLFLPPSSVAFVSPQLDPAYRRIRIVGEYSCEASHLARFLSRGIGILPPNLLPGKLQVWFVNHGLVDGTLHGRVESSWMLNQVSGGNRRPISAPGAARTFSQAVYALETDPGGDRSLSR